MYYFPSIWFALVGWKGTGWVGLCGCFVCQRKLGKGCCRWKGRRLVKTLEFKFNFFAAFFHPARAKIVKASKQHALHKDRWAFCPNQIMSLFLEVLPLFFSLSVTLYQSFPGNSWQSIKSMGSDGSHSSEYWPHTSFIHLTLSNNSIQHIGHLFKVNLQSLEDAYSQVHFGKN